VDQKQFDLFQTAIQWVWDEWHRKIRGDARQGPIHKQVVWAAGTVTDQMVPVAEDETYRWGEWVSVICPTACCVAGNIVMVHGDQFVTKQMPNEFVAHVEMCIDDHGRVHGISDRAQGLAGLTGSEASRLFHQDNNAHSIVQIAQMIAARHGYELEVK
jgi:hypothetical protein